MIVQDKHERRAVNWSLELVRLFVAARITPEEVAVLPQAQRAKHLRDLVRADMVSADALKRLNACMQNLPLAVLHDDHHERAKAAAVFDTWSGREFAEVLALFLLEGVNFCEVAAIFED